MTDGPLPTTPESPHAHEAGADGPPKKTPNGPPAHARKADSQLARGTYPHDADPAQLSATLTTPREGTPKPVETEDELRAAVDQLAAGSGPLAVDAERASGYRYSHRAYLIQLRRAGAGTVLVDPVPFEDLSHVGATLAHGEWVLHAASQDLPCLTEVGMRPRLLFDTELGARLAGFERVGLAALTERLLGYTLEKHHSAADWSTRPLPKSWLTYAALDVELLVELRYALATELERQGKLGWAEEEFAALLAAPPPKPRADPWRRTSGIHKARGPRALARVRALWRARDEVARHRNVAPGRVLPDAAVVAAAQADPADQAALSALPGFGGRSARRLGHIWLRALAEARALPDSELPPATAPSDGPPPAHRWPDRDPVAAKRLARCRAVVNHLSEELMTPPENLLSPDTVRRLAWSPPQPLSRETTLAALADHGARRWQLDLVGEQLTAALADG